MNNFDAVAKIMDDEITKPFNEDLKRFAKNKNRKPVNEGFGIEVPEEDQDAPAEDAPIESDVPAEGGEEEVPEEQSILAQGKWTSGDYELTIDGSTLTVVCTTENEDGSACEPMSFDLMSAEAADEEPAEEPVDEPAPSDVSEGVKGRVRKKVNEDYEDYTGRGYSAVKITTPEAAVEASKNAGGVWFGSGDGSISLSQPGGTSGAGMAAHYLKKGPLYAITKDGKIMGMAHPVTNTYMDVRDVEITGAVLNDIKTAIRLCDN